MEIKKFEKLLSSYLDGQITDDQLLAMHQAIEKHPQLRRRFQRQTRIHALLYETITEQNEKTKLTVTPDRQRPVIFFAMKWKTLAVAAACVALSGIIWFYNLANLDAAGYCLHVSNYDNTQLYRDGKTIKVETGTRIYWNDIIETTSDAEVLIELEQVGIISLEGSSKVHVQNIPDKGCEIFLKKGNALFDIDKQDPSLPLTVKTRDATMNILGTVFALETLPTTTRVKVYEGLVDFHDNQLKDSVYITAEQYCITGRDTLLVEDMQNLQPDSLLPSQVRLSPTDDVFQEKNEIINDKLLKVEGKKRTIFLKFKIEDVGDVLGAELHLTQHIDPGAGTLQFWEGSHSDWTEQTITPDNAPSRVKCIAQRSGLVRKKQTIKVDVHSLIHQEGQYTLIVTLDKSGNNDIWFGSRESNLKPQLIITCRNNR